MTPLGRFEALRLGRCENRRIAMLDTGLVTRLYREAGAERWHVAPETFRAALQASVDKTFAGNSVDRSEVERYLNGLHLDDLALACACADGDDDAWQHFILTFRPVLYRTADNLGAGGAARECADAIYGDLFAAPSSGATRQSLFRYFHGRSSMANWLKAVLSQRWVDQVRRQRRLEPLTDVQSSTPSATPDVERSRFVVLMSAVLAAVMAALEPRDRFRLNCYYAQRLTLAQIGRLLSEHEATVSRQLARLRREVRARVEETLSKEHGLSDAEIGECFATVSDDPGPLDINQLLGSSDAEESPGGTTEPTPPPGGRSAELARGARKKVALARSSKGRQS